MLVMPRLPLMRSLPPVRLYFAPYCALMLGLAAPVVMKKSSEWDICYLVTTQHLLAGEDLYDQPHGYVYPPLQSLLTLPVVWLPNVVQKLIWFAVNAVCLWIVLRTAWQLAGGPDLDRERVPLREHVASAVGLVIGLTYFLNSLMHHQTDIVLAALLFTGIDRLHKGRALRAAVLFGVATAMKCTPLLFTVYLLWRGHFRAAMLLILVAIGVSLLPDLFLSPAEGGTWLAKWFRLFLAPMAGAEHRPGVWASDVVFNQSLIGAVNRWSLTSWTVNGSFAVVVIEPLLTPGWMKAISLGLALLLAAVSLGVLLAVLKHPPLYRTAWESTLVICGMLLLSPMSSPAHFGLLVLPAFLLTRSRSQTSHAIVAAMAVLAMASNKDLLGAAAYSIALWYGIVMAAALLALAGSWRELIVQRQPA